jgi:hypothetical protein
MKSKVTRSVLSGIIELEDDCGAHHSFHFTERNGGLLGVCGRILLGVMLDTPGNRLAVADPFGMLQLIARHSVPCVSECRLMFVLWNTQLPASERIHARRCVVSLHP